MPDASTHRQRPSEWSEAFAALPAETPPAGGWERVVRALPVRRRRWPALIALAAALALVAIVPLRWSRQDAVPSTPLVRAPDAATPGQPAVAPVDRPTQADDSARSPSNAATTPVGDTAAIASAEPASAGESARTPPASQRPATSTQPSTGTTGASQLASAPAPASPQDAIEPPATPELERLYAESAQLEGLLALARDGGGEVANGAVAMLSDDLATRVAQIDAALMQPSLASDRRIALWRERVDALRQAAAFESTQRLLAARGQQYDAMLVSID